MLLSRFENFISSLYKSFRFSYHRLREIKQYGKHDFRYSDALASKNVIVLANGPSLKEDLDNIKQRAKDNASYLYGVNDLAMTDLFVELKPELYCFIDCLYFREEANEYRIYECLNERVTWNMQLFVPLEQFEYVKERISNNRVQITPVSTLLFEGFEKNKYLCYKKGKAVPSFINVVNLAVYTTLNMGVKDIYLYGVDHTFLRLISVDDDNNLCLRDEHFYGTQLIHMPPKVDGSSWHVSDFVYDKYLTFKEHDNIRGYADYLDAQIINCTKCSCIDSYVRLSQIENNKTAVK